MDFLKIAKKGKKSKKSSAKDYMEGGYEDNGEREEEKAEKKASASDFLKLGMAIMPPHFNENTDVNTSGGIADFVSAAQLMPKMFSRPMAYFDTSQPTPDGNIR